MIPINCFLQKIVTLLIWSVNNCFEQKKFWYEEKLSIIIPFSMGTGCIAEKWGYKDDLQVPSGKNYQYINKSLLEVTLFSNALRVELIWLMVKLFMDILNKINENWSHGVVERLFAYTNALIGLFKLWLFFLVLITRHFNTYRVQYATLSTAWSNAC